MNIKQGKILLWAIVILILGGTVFALAMLPKKEVVDRPGNDQTAQVPPVTDVDWIAGNKNSTVTLVEYADFQCPACAAYHPLVGKLLKENGQDFRLVYRHFPLRQHAQAKDAAYAAEAAGRQGKFFEMYDLIYRGQSSWAEKNNAKDIFLDYVKTLDLNLEQYNKDFNSSEVKNRVEADLQSALKIGVNSTPTFYLNQKKIQPQSYEEFVNLIKQANVDSTSSPQATP